MSQKSDRVASIIKKSVSEYLNKELRDQDLSFPTVTDVTVTNDLSYAKIYVTFWKNEEKGLASLNKAKGRIRTHVSKQLDTKKCPELIFELDKSLETGNRIDAIIDELNSKENPSS